LLDGEGPIVITPTGNYLSNVFFININATPGIVFYKNMPSDAINIPSNFILNQNIFNKINML
jgi:hypothetical protein